MLRPLLSLLLVGVPAAAFADDLGVVVEPGLAIPISKPQSDLYNVGGGQAIKVLFGVAPYLDVGPAIAFLYLPSETANLEPGIEWGFGGTARLHRAHDADSAAGVAPWLDVDLRYVRTGDLNRPGFAIGAGLAVPLDGERRYWLGPYVRYAQTIGFSEDRVDSSDAKTLLIGVSFEVGSPGKRAAPPIVVPPPPPPPVAEAVISCPDRDGDGIPDAIDHCPDVAGVMENFGCPNYQKLVVKKDKLELKEKLYFAWDKAVLEPASFPVLDEVVQALTDNQGFRVQIEGHTDSSGADDHNQTLSEQRAGAVLDYLAAHGIAKARLVSKGFASSVPIDTNATVAGRENNRRVEFVVNFVILNPDGAK